MRFLARLIRKFRRRRPIQQRWDPRLGLPLELWPDNDPDRAPGDRQAASWASRWFAERAARPGRVPPGWRS